MIKITGVKDKKLKGIYKNIDKVKDGNRKTKNNLNREMFGIDWVM